MSWLDFLTRALGSVGAFGSTFALLFFVVCLVGEAAGISVPFLLETALLMAGYRFSAGNLSFLNLAFLALMTQAGRQAGAFALYNLGGRGSALLGKYQKRLLLKTGTMANGSSWLSQRIDRLSPFSVALGRLLWLRIPLTLILGAKRKLGVLVLGIMLSSLAYDGAYMIIGAIAGITMALKPAQMLLFFLGGLSSLYAITFVARRVIAFFGRRRKIEASEILD